MLWANKRNVPPILTNRHYRVTQISTRHRPAKNIFKEEAMRAQSAAFGIAAAAALSSAASALPCTATAPSNSTTSGFTCTVTDKTSSSLGGDQQGDPGAGASGDESQPPAGQSVVLIDASEPAALAGPETFAGHGIKITNLQATMTSNKYVAGRLPLAPQSSAIEDLMMFSPDYLSVKMLPRIQKRNPVGVGLVTVPKPTTTESDTTPDIGGPRQTRPER